MVSRRSLVQLAEILLHQLLLLSNKLCTCLVPRRRYSQPMRRKRRVRLAKVGWANMGCRASKPGREVVVVDRMMVVMRCGRGIEDRRGALARRRNRCRTLVTGGSALGGGVLRVDVVPDDEMDGHLVRAAKL